MEVSFKIHYQTKPGEQLCVCGSGNYLGNWDITKALKLNYQQGGVWTNVIELTKAEKSIEYKYLLINDNGDIIWEWGPARKLNLEQFTFSFVHLLDTWFFPPNDQKVLFSSAFTKAIMQPEKKAKGGSTKAKKAITFRIRAPRIAKGQQLCVTGNQKDLGDWDKSSPLLLGCGEDFPLWIGSINAGNLTLPIVYKYGIYDINKKEIVH